MIDNLNSPSPRLSPSRFFPRQPHTARQCSKKKRSATPRRWWCWCGVEKKSRRRWVRGKKSETAHFRRVGEDEATNRADSASLSSSRSSLTRKNPLQLGGPYVWCPQDLALPATYFFSKMGKRTSQLSGHKHQRDFYFTLLAFFFSFFFAAEGDFEACPERKSICFECDSDEAGSCRRSLERNTSQRKETKIFSILQVFIVLLCVTLLGLKVTRNREDLLIAKNEDRAVLF